MVGKKNRLFANKNVTYTNATDREQMTINYYLSFTLINSYAMSGRPTDYSVY